MSYAINLYFNEEAEKSIINIWETLSLLGIGKCMSCLNGRPHITLAIFDELDLAQAREQLMHLAETVPVFSLKLLQVGMFPHNKGAIFLAPNLPDKLFQIHRDLHKMLGAWDEHSWDYYKPQDWYPHCTLSLETPIGEIPEVLRELLKIFQPIDITIEAIGMVSLEPIDYLCEFSLHQHMDN
ncbi:2'-5' RNA ligase [Desulfitobacterium dichloroeliminans LMG P-21439]|uniref:2'-5' RNA ligase n=1 Tax=Desulfitobacterium dichloroeliminans (strain LMG P-21439 / DCA1) TaxID=871963 RepID=L0FCC7_DESDL|nr:2'-5' RNA ligase family protein [Desulfitobacterium dichloroeliminans]AGA70872.1 2'-5' RNA ligase [Desulfitobacterium dichloroeliminans LMG P-21439]